MENEVWRDIVGYSENYQVSNLGRVRSKDRLSSSGQRLKGKERKLNLQKRTGYYHVNLCKNGKVTHYGVHRLVAEAFIPNPENKEQVNHKDGDKTNNNLSNLEWATRTENVNHAIKLGLLSVAGVDNNKAKLTDGKVRKMRYLRELDRKKYTYKKLGELFGVSSVMANDICTMKRWKHVRPNATNIGSEIK